MAGTDEMLRSTLGERGHAFLSALAARAEPASGRAIASELKVSPATASRWLHRLEGGGYARSDRPLGWRLNKDSEVVRAWLRERRVTATSMQAEPGSSPASTGGAGVTFERKLAADYLARLLLGHDAVGVGPGRVVVSVAFQQAPEFSVDDLVVGAAADGESKPSLTFAVAARRTPNVVASDEKSKALFRSFVKQLLVMPADGPELRLGLAVAGWQKHAKQLADLAMEAADQEDADKFFALIRTPDKFGKQVRERLLQVERLVRQALVDLGMPEPSAELVEKRVWELLSRLVVLMPRVESGDEADWSTLANLLIPVSRGEDLYGGTLLRDRLLALADDWAPSAASVSVPMLRRAVHDLLDPTARRSQAGWRALELLGVQAQAAVGDQIGSADGARQVRIDRSDLAGELGAAIASSSGIVVHGESGVGKSSATLGFLATAGSDELQVVRMNLRHLPGTVLEFERSLGASLHDLLGEMSAPVRVVAVDGADAVAEGAQDLLAYVLDAAVAAQVRVVVVTAADAKQLVLDAVGQRVGEGLVQVEVPPLTDSQVDIVVSEFVELEPMAENPRSRELLRRPVVVDLLVRGGVQGAPVSDVDAMQQVWDGLVRRRTPGRGTPEARSLVMLQLARQTLVDGRDQLDVAGELDATALEGLRNDGLLRTSQDNPFRLVPEFAHDEVRRYAVARLLLADGNPTRVLADAGVPRWALGAARLACQALFVAPDSSSNPTAGRFLRWQAKFDELVAAGNGERWTDVPGEALLTLGDSRPVLREAWADLQGRDRAGVKRLIRLSGQRLRGRNTFLRAVAVEPLVELLLEDETPWRSGDAEKALLLDWLQSLAASDVPAGHELRIQLRTRLLAFCAEAEIPDPAVVELFALLGPDLGDDGEEVLRRIAEVAPEALAPALEGVLCGRALAGYRQGFLAELVLAYYLDEEEDGSRRHADGVRRHTAFGFGFALAAWYRGPFAALLQSDFRHGVSVLNRILNHAVTCRARSLVGRAQYLQQRDVDAALDRYRTELSITGAPHVYVGDAGAWNWYRGTGVGPYPCMSALQALEQVCDGLIERGAPLELLVQMLLDGCDNVAMVALVVGLLVRHMDKAGTLLDRFLAEPEVWHFEFARVVHEHSALRAPSDGVVGGDRRAWSLREVATSQVFAAGPERAEELRLVGQQLVENARRRLEQFGDSTEPDADLELNTARAWASGLDRSTYTMQRTGDGIVVQSHPAAEVAAAISAGISESAPIQEATRLIVRYHIHQENGAAEAITPEELIADLTSALGLLDGVSETDLFGWDAPAAVAAYAVTECVLHGVSLPEDSLKIAADIVLRAGEQVNPDDNEDSYFSQGADRSAARALSLLLTPDAAHLRRLIDGGDGADAYARVETALIALAGTNVLQTRLFLARGLDYVWAYPCTGGAGCQHRVALRTAIATMRECVLGAWDGEQEEFPLEELEDPILDTLAAVPSDNVYLPRLDAAIRALAPAAVADICVAAEARALLDTVLDAQRRALIDGERGIDDRGSHALVAARALLTLDDDNAILNHVDACAGNAAVLGQALRALSATAEEGVQRAGTARRIWPRLVERLLDGPDSAQTLAAVIPTPAGDRIYLHTEFTDTPIVWWDPVAWQDTINRWLDLAGGEPSCVDSLIRCLTTSLPSSDQARLGVSWVARLVLEDPAAVVDRCYHLTTWLMEIRTAADEADLTNVWQRAVDALVVAGNTQLAPYSE